MRWYGHNSAGWFDLTDPILDYVSRRLKVSKRTVKLNFDKVCEVGWAYKVNKNGVVKYKFYSSEYINWILGTDNRFHVGAEVEKHLFRPYMIFQAFCSEGYKREKIHTRNARKKYKSFLSSRTGLKDRVGISPLKVCDKMNLSSSKSGCWAMELCSMDLERSKSCIHRLKVISMREGFAVYIPTVRQDFYELNLQTWKQVIDLFVGLRESGHYIEISHFRWDMKSSRYLLRDCDVIISKLSTKSKRIKRRSERAMRCNIQNNPNLYSDLRSSTSYKELPEFTTKGLLKG